MSKRFLRVLSVFLVALLLVTSAPLSGVELASAAATTTNETKYLFEKVTSLELGKQYAIVVKYQNRYYAVQNVDPEVEDISDAMSDTPEPAQAYLSLNLNTATTRDVTNMIIEDGSKSYLVGVDDTVLWDTPKNAQGRSGSYVYVNSVYTQVNSGIVVRSMANPAKNIYMGQVIRDDDGYYVTAGGTYGLWTLPPAYGSEPYKNERGLYYNHDSSTGTGELYAVGAGGTYFLEFKQDSVTGGMKFDNHKEDAIGTIRGTSNYPKTSSYSAEILLFCADSSSDTIPVTKTVNDETYIADKYIEYKWNYNGANGAYQIVYKNSAIGFDETVVPVFIPANELQAGHAYVLASETNTLKENLSAFTLSSADAVAVNDDNPADTLAVGLDDTFLTDGGAYWTSEAYNAANGEYHLFYQADKASNTTKYYLSAADCALFTGSNKSTWSTVDGKLKAYSDGTFLYYDGTGWVLLESLSNVTLYDVVFANMSNRPATCIEGDSKWYNFAFDGKNYTCKYYLNDTVNPTNHYSSIVDSTVKADPTCMRAGYEGALICSGCHQAVGYEKEIAINPNAHSMANVYNGNRTHSYKCVNTDLIGNVCTHVQSTTACSDTNKDCVCDVCLHALDHIANIDAATCTEDKVCTVCGLVLEKATGHEISANVVSLNDGTHAYTCSKCGLAVGAEACFDNDSNCICDACNYQFAHTPGVAATCITAQTCVVCHTVLAEAKGHSYTGAVRCYNDGTHAYKCVNGCGTYGTAVGMNAKEACVDSAEDDDCKCDICGYQLSHTPGAAATCTTAQLCTLCGTVIKPALGHNFNGTARDNGDGTHSYLCSSGCGLYGANVNGVQTVDATETCLKSSIDCKCSVCGRQFDHEANIAEATCVTAKVCNVCGTVLEAKKEHSYTGEARDNKNGTHSYKCVNGCSNYGNPTDCFDSATDSDCLCDTCGAQLAHTPGAAANCTEAQTCTICGTVITAKLGHDYSGSAVSDGEGNHAGQCSRCGASGTSEACYDNNRDCKCDVCEYQFAHTPNAENATCLAAKYCTNCGTVLEAKLEHSYTGAVRSYNNGYHANLCVNGCGLYGNRTACVDADSDCTCDVCGYKLAHQPGAAATCDSAQICTVCGVVLEAALGHSYNGDVRDNGNGTHSYACLNGCGKYGNTEDCTRSTVDCRCIICDHQFDHTPGAAATCLAIQSCTYCHTKLADRLSHSYTGTPRSNGDGTHSFLCVNGCGNYGNATACADTRKDDCKCDVCSYQLEHTEVADPAVAETCTTDGKTAGSHCAVCGTVFVAQEIIPAINHRNSEYYDEIPATCYEPGVTAGQYCPDCDTWIHERLPIAKNEHDMVIDAGTPATCLADGISEGKHCALCGEIVVAQEVLPKTGHSFKETVVPATCQQQGFTMYTCEYCGYRYFGNYVDGDHIDNDNDGYCDICGFELFAHEPDTRDCSCMCHKTNGFSRFIYSIVLTFWKLFNTNKTCSCGINHY